jgi:uncharacterized protein (TIGR02300 family)
MAAQWSGKSRPETHGAQLSSGSLKNWGGTKVLTGAPDGGKRAPRVGRLARRGSAKESRLAKTDLGSKQVCPNCGAKFYDLSRRPAVCPKCTTSFDPAEEGVRARRGRARVSAHDPAYDDDEEAEDKKKAKVGDDEDEEEEVEETAEIDVEAEAEPVVVDDDEDAEATSKTGGDDELPEGFSEEEADLGDDAADDDSVPMLEDEEEFPEDEIGELPGGDDDDDSGR